MRQRGRQQVRRRRRVDLKMQNLIQYKDSETGVIIAASVRLEFEDGQPRVRDLDLGEWLGYTRPIAIRLTIKRNLEEIEALGRVFTVKTRPETGGSEATEYWLTEEQAIAVCQLSQAMRAGQVRIMLRKMFVEYRRGALVPVTSDAVIQSLAWDRLATTLDRVAESCRANTHALMRIEVGQVATSHRLDNVEGGLSTLAQQVDQVTRQVSQAAARGRRDAKSGDVAFMLKVVAAFYGGKCPGCEDTLIVTQGGEKATAWTVDHTNGAWDNRPEHMWPVCGKCNARLYNEAGFRDRMRAEFAIFQKRLWKVRPSQLKLM